MGRESVGKRANRHPKGATNSIRYTLLRAVQKAGAERIGLPWPFPRSASEAAAGTVTGTGTATGYWLQFRGSVRTGAPCPGSSAAWARKRACISTNVRFEV